MQHDAWYPPVDVQCQAGDPVQLVVQRCQPADGADAVGPFPANMSLTFARQHQTCRMDGVVHSFQVQQQVGVFCVRQTPLNQLKRQTWMMKTAFEHSVHDNCFLSGAQSAACLVTDARVGCRYRQTTVYLTALTQYTVRTSCLTREIARNVLKQPSHATI